MKTSGMFMWWICLACVASVEAVEVPSCTSARTRPLNWTFYVNLTFLSWNEASEFCRQRGAHLPTLSTHLAATAFQTAFNESQFELNELPPGTWLGLHSVRKGTVLNVWEKDCSIVQQEVEYWDGSVGEPNNLDFDRCASQAFSSKLWTTESCDSLGFVVCEKISVGNCTYHSLEDAELSTPPNTTKTSVHGNSQCWSLCLQLQLGGMECVVAVLEGPTLTCKLYLGTRLPSTDIPTTTSQGSTVMLRRCFRTNADLNPYSDFQYSDQESSPNPANVTCIFPTYPQNPAAVDCVPPGVRLAANTSTEYPTTDAMRTATTDKAANATSTTTTDAVSTTTTNAMSTTTTDAMSTTTTNAMSTTTSNAMSTTTTDAVNSAVSTFTTDVATSATSQPPTTTQETTPSQPATVTDPHHCMCRCACPTSNNDSSQVNNDQAKSNPFGVKLIPANETSKYRRSKTSAMVSETTYTVIGGSWIIAIGAAFSLILISDLQHLKHMCRWLVKRKKTEVGVAKQ